MNSSQTHPISPNFRTLDLNLLRVFDEVMAERSLTKAAHNLSLTQPAVSNAMRRLRETLGDDLVRRSGQGLEPTPRANALWPAVREALRQLQETLVPNPFDAATSTATFVLAMADATASELIPGLLTVAERDAPGVSLRIVPLSTRDPRRLLDAEAADLAIGHFPAALADLTASAQAGGAVSYAHQRLYEGEYVCVMRKNHHLADKPLTIARYCEARHLLVSFSGRPFGFIDEALASLQRKRRVVITVNQFFTAGRVVSQSDLLTVLPRHFVRVADAGHSLIVKDLPFEMPVVHVDALWHKRLQHSSAHQWLRGAIAASAKLAFAEISTA
jgi:DNA-binding transcriptional LysR family regulator